MARRPQIIGGMFAIEPLSTRFVHPPFWKEPAHVLASARSGIRLVLECRQLKRIWLPSFLCSSIIDAAAAANTEIHFYGVDERLKPMDEEWGNQIRPRDLVLFIDYFGRPTPADMLSRAKNRGAVILEDACQSLLSPVSDVADYVLYSPRKFVGVSDGGFLLYREGDAVASTKLNPGAEDWIQMSLKAGELRKDFDGTGAENGWFKTFQEAEKLCPTEPFAMSHRARQNLFGCDYSAIAEKRRENYGVLLRVLEEIALFPELPAGVVPLGFPVVMKERDHARNKLFENRIYPPVHWPVPDMVPAKFDAGRRLAANIMTLPCDQRYSTEDMNRVCRILLSA